METTRQARTAANGVERRPSGAHTPQNDNTASRERCRVPLFKIVRNGDFVVRRGALDRAHVRVLAGALRSSGRLDPVLLWQGPDQSEKDRYTLLDGAHRVAAYQSAKSGHESIPAVVVTCNRRTALLLAAQANSKDTLSLTYAEKADMAWRLVREPEAKYSKAEIATATGVSERTVATMRQRWKELQREKREPSGNWNRDRMAHQVDGGNMLDDTAYNAEVGEKAKRVLQAVDGVQRRDTNMLGDILEAAFGHHLRGAMDYLFGDVDEWSREGLNLGIEGEDDGEPEETDF